MGLRRGFGGMSAVLRGTAMGAVRVGGRAVGEVGPVSELVLR